MPLGAYIVAGALIVSAIMNFLASSGKKAFFARKPTARAASISRQCLMQLCYECDRILSAYRRLNDSNKDIVRYPFNPASWLNTDRTWNYIHAQLYCLDDQTHELSKKLDICGSYGWDDWSEYQIPTASPDTLMVDFLAEMLDLLNYLKTKIPPLSSVKGRP